MNSKTTILLVMFITSLFSISCKSRQALDSSIKQEYSDSETPTEELMGYSDLIFNQEHRGYGYDKNQKSYEEILNFRAGMKLQNMASNERLWNDNSEIMTSSCLIANDSVVVSTGGVKLSKAENFDRIKVYNKHIEKGIIGGRYKCPNDRLQNVQVVDVEHLTIDKYYYDLPLGDARFATHGSQKNTVSGRSYSKHTEITIKARDLIIPVKIKSLAANTVPREKDCQVGDTGFLVLYPSCLRLDRTATEMIPLNE